MPQEQTPTHSKCSMPIWADVEDFMAYWHRTANETAWRDLYDARGTMDYLAAPVPHRCPSLEYLTGTDDPEELDELDRHLRFGTRPICETCSNRADLAIWLEERATSIADDLRAELRLRAANVSTLQSQG